MRNITAIGYGRRPPFAPALGQCGAITPSRTDHGTTAAISARNTSRFVLFFLPANSRDAKLSCASIVFPSNQEHQCAMLPEVDQSFPKSALAPFSVVAKGLLRALD